MGWALEGTGSFAAGLAEALVHAGQHAVEVGALKRSRGPKSDRLDAVRAARTAMARQHQAIPKAINALKSLVVVAPEHLRSGLRGRSLARQLAIIESMTTSPSAAVDHRITVMTLRSVAARIKFLTEQLKDIDPELEQLITAHPPGPRLLQSRRRAGRCSPGADQLVTPRQSQE